ncbi:hypothetical protein CRG98_010675 [Punica granatum]|uniref:Uncharacterized protein n=1 Tax=Punica granatum TaxID=22663 RepID=A0A2I0KKH0_PUNGR|nr:hypothetical protein CRG98_010675 [Punica granatum]
MREDRWTRLVKKDEGVGTASGAGGAREVRRPRNEGTRSTFEGGNCGIRMYALEIVEPAADEDGALVGKKPTPVAKLWGASRMPRAVQWRLITIKAVQADKTVAEAALFGPLKAIGGWKQTGAPYYRTNLRSLSLPDRGPRSRWLTLFFCKGTTTRIKGASAWTKAVINSPAPKFGHNIL